MSKKYLALFLYFIVLTKSLFASTLGFSLIDEGEYLHNALRILNGDILYKDFFSYQPPLYNYWNVMAFKLLGIDVYSARLFNSIIFSFATVLMFFIIGRFSSKVVAFVIALALSFMELSQERLYYYIFPFLGLFIFFENKFTSNKLIFSGFLFGLTSLFRLDVGILYFSGLSLWLIVKQTLIDKDNLKDFLKIFFIFSLGFIIPIFLLILWLLDNNTVSEFTRSQLNTPLQITASHSLPFPAIWEVIPTNFSPKSLFHSYETYVLYVFLGVYLIFAILLFKSWKEIFKNTPQVIAFFIIGILMLPYMLGRTDLGHIVKACIPAFFVAAYLINRLNKFKNLLLLIPLSFIVVGVAQVVWSNNFYNTKVQTRNGTIRLNNTWFQGSVLIPAESVKKSLEFIEHNTSEDDQILAAPYMAGLYFLSDRPSKSYVGNIWYTYVPNEQEFVNQLSQLNIKVIVYDPVNGPEGEGGFNILKSYYPQIDKFILENFEVRETLPEGWLLMIRK